MSLDQVKFDDVVFVSARPDVSIIVNIPGQYSLSDRWKPCGERRVFACRAVSASARAIALLCPVNGKAGNRVIAHIDHLGKLEGPSVGCLSVGSS